MTLGRTALAATPLAVLTLAVPLALASRGTLDAASPVTGSGASTATFLGASRDAQTVAFSTVDALDPADTDGKLDLYVRRGAAAPVLLTPGVSPISPNDAQFAQVRVLAGGDVAFLTPNRLAATDVDGAGDLYLAKANGTVVHVSNNNGAAVGVLPTNVVASEDGSAIAFSTTEDLVAADTSSGVADVYRYAGTTLSLVTLGADQGTASGISPNGSRVYWESGAEQAAFGDNDAGGRDLFYAEAPGFMTTKSPTFAYTNPGATAGLYAGQSPDGTTIVVRTGERLDPGTDTTAASPDLYAFRGAAPAALATGPGSGPTAFPIFQRACNDGAVVFTSEKPLLPGDADADADDVYRRTATALTRLSSGAGTGASVAVPVAVSGDCSELAWLTGGQESGEDTDDATDLYVARSGGTPRLASQGAPTSVSVPNGTMTPSGTTLPTLLFTSPDRLTTADADTADDVYAWDAASGGLSLVSGTTGGAASGQPLAAQSEDAATFLVTTTEALAGDADTAADVYRYAVGPDPAPAPPVTTSTTTPTTGTPTPGGGVPIPGPAGPAAAPKRPTITTSTRGITVGLSRGVATIKTKGRVTCPAGGASCRVLTAATAGGKRYASRTVQLGAGKSQAITLRLPSTALKKLRKAKGLKLRFTVTATKPGAAAVTKRFTATVKAPRKR